mmetsp:Transcript_14629/g.61045  ORF Transcript_14629/g.61045 Transcript_14629/m.61045 type:complete len:240 (+) Transcript_14629:2618-3337(+)
MGAAEERSRPPGQPSPPEHRALHGGVRGGAKPLFGDGILPPRLARPAARAGRQAGQRQAARQAEEDAPGAPGGAWGGLSALAQHHPPRLEARQPPGHVQLRRQGRRLRAVSLHAGERGVARIAGGHRRIHGARNPQVRTLLDEVRRVELRRGAVRDPDWSLTVRAPRESGPVHPRRGVPRRAPAPPGGHARGRGGHATRQAVRRVHAAGAQHAPVVPRDRRGAPGGHVFAPAAAERPSK